MKFWIFFILIVFTGCSSRKVVRTSEVINTKLTTSVDTFFHEKTEIIAGAIPAERATISTTVDEIRNLSGQAVITDRQGRASVTVRYLRDTVVIEAVCDSLERQITSYELREKSYLNTIEESEKQIKTIEEKQQKNGILTAFEWCIMSFTAGAAITLLFTKKSLINSIIEFIKKIFKK
jgi:hypothetical protein